jgi:hypothetical protein
MPSATGNIVLSSQIIQQTPTGTINGSNVSFTLSNTPAIAATVVVYVDGAIQIQSTDYTLTTNTITFTVAPATGQSIIVQYSIY